MSLEKNLIRLMFEMDKELCGDHMHPGIAALAVHMIGERFNRRWAHEHLPSMDINEEDFYYVANMTYSDYKEMFNEEEEKYAEMAKLFIQDADGPADKAKRYFYTMLEALLCKD